jgi:hypothetical protein
VITEARRVIEEQVEDRTTVPLRGATATHVLRGPWPYEGQPAQPAQAAADGPRPTEVAATGHLGLMALLLALIAVVLGGLVWWRR